jgi:hypothetical protein
MVSAAVKILSINPSSFAGTFRSALLVPLSRLGSIWGMSSGLQPPSITPESRKAPSTPAIKDVCYHTKSDATSDEVPFAR